MEVAQVKHKSEGVKHCCYGTCNSDTRYRHRDDMKDVFFIPFQKPITQREKCERWIKACGRTKEDFNVEKIKRCTYMCSKHFVGSKGPTVLHPDPLPALLHNEEQIDRFKRKRKAPTPRKQHIKILRKDVTTAAESLLQLSEYTGSDPSIDKDCTESITSTLAQCETHQEKSVQTESGIQHDKEVQTVYEKEILNAKIENMVLKNKMKVEQNQENKNASSDAMLSLESLKSDDARLKLFTGLQYNQFMTLFEFLGESVNKLTYWDGKNTRENVKKGNRKLEPKEELFLTLVRLKRGFNLDVMSHFFRLSSSTVSVIFTTWIQFLYCHFNDYRNIMFPERQHFKKYMPRVFRCFKNIRCTIDCTEFFVQMPRDFRRQGNLYSSYKSHHTYKCLIGVAPNGAIVYVSNLYEGSISDRAIVEKCGFLEYINPSDLVLADRGFLIEDFLMARQATLNIPPFLGKRSKFTAQEELQTRRIAKARIHVERVIERVKKFKLLSGNIPLSLTQISDQMVFVACCLVNFQEPLVK